MPEKYTLEQKITIVIESFTSTNISELCRRCCISVARFHRWKERFIEGGSKALGESSKGSKYQKEIGDLKRLVGDRALVITALKKKSTGEEMRMIVENLRDRISIARISTYLRPFLLLQLDLELFY